MSRAVDYTGGLSRKALAQALLLWPGLAAPEGPPAPPVTPGKTVGGQAVIEGVMMRGPGRWAVMVRKTDGSIEGSVKDHRAWTNRKPWKYPFARGLAVLVESLVLGVKALSYSTEVTAGDQMAAARGQDAPKADGDGRPDAKAIGPLAIFLSLALGLGMGLFLFVALPHVLSIWLGVLGGFDEMSLLFHLLDGLLKFAIFLAYVWGIGLIPDIARVYAYHGAEHQAIHVYEAGLPLSPAEARAFPTWHPRCGTAFIFLVLSASILFFAIAFPLLAPFGGLERLPRALAGVGLKILFTPLLAAVAYEITRLAGRPESGRLWRALVWPGLILQRITTRRPDEAQLEVAFKSLEAVLPEKGQALESPCPSN